MVDQRHMALSEWAAKLLNDPHCRVRPASADASFRRYFRVHGTSGETFIVMDAPPGKEDCGPYLQVARAFRASV